MKDGGKKPNIKGHFKKRAHRPWKTSLLERTIEETTIDLNSSMFELDIDFDLDLEATEDLDSFYPEIDFTEEITTATIVATKNELAIVDSQLPSDTKITNKLSLGGFFKTQQYISETNIEATRKITDLLTTLKTREHNVEINEAKMRQAMEQADTIAQQFETAIEQASKAANAHQSEINLRKQIEMQLAKEQLRTKNLQLELQEQNQLRMSLESKLTVFPQMESDIVNLTNEIAELQNELQQQQALLSSSRDSADIINDLQLQLKNQQQTLTMAEAEAQQTASALNKAQSLERQLQDVTNSLRHLELEKSSLQNNLTQLRHEYMNFKQQHIACTAQIDELESQGASNLEFANTNSKLKSIIATEQQLRKISEQQAQETKARFEKVATQLQHEIQQRKLTEERAKLAIEHANSTVQQLLNNQELTVETVVVAPTVNQAKLQVSYDYEPDDLNY